MSNGRYTWAMHMQNFIAKPSLDQKLQASECGPPS